RAGLAGAAAPLPEAHAPEAARRRQGLAPAARGVPPRLLRSCRAMIRSRIRSATTQSPPSGTAVALQEDGGDPKHQILFSCMQIEARQQGEKPDEQPQPGFHELLERLASAHDAEIRSTADRLESLQRQNNVFRSQLIEMRQKLQQSQPPTRQGRSKTHGARTSPMQLEEPDKAPALPGILDLTADGMTTANAAENSERDGEDAEETKVEVGQEQFPPRSEYMMGHQDTLERRNSWSSKIVDLHSSVKRQGSKESNSLSDSSLDIRTSRRAYSGLMASFVASPRSTARTAWEILGCVLIGWDLLIVPLAVFCYPVNSLTMSMEWLTLVYWTLNIPQTLTVGYEVGLGIVMSPSLILRRYMRSWFLIDMATLVPDWIIEVIDFGNSNTPMTSCDTSVEGATAVKLLKNLRIMRLMRLTRIARLKKIWQMVKDRIYSLTVNIAVNILTMLLLLLVLSHFISCLWYTISDVSEGDNRWLAYYNFEGMDWSYVYATCLHWSLTRHDGGFTPASMDIQPQNFPERVYTISVVVCALVGFSYVVGSITASLAQLRSVTEEESKLFWDLRVYLKRNAVEHTLAIRIQRYLVDAWRYQAGNKTFSQIKILTMLSEQLHNELLFNLHADHLNVYPLIEALLDVSPVTAFRLARTAILSKQFAYLDPMFIYGEKPSHMSIVKQGRFEYKRMTSKGEVLREMVDKGEDWIAEPVLWSTQWYHLGDCVAVDTSSLILVDPHKFCEEAKRNPAAWSLVTTYCRNFLAWLNSTDSDELSDITQGDHLDKKAQLKKFMVVIPRVLADCTADT
ncbi:unnamed protein product, partial [Prorocentrum cordatum]